jgi:CheY-like chemotaxis protein
MEKARILLVDDRQENLLALEAILSSLDQTLVRAGSGEEALKALLNDEFAVILLDVQMPGMDGFETASHIKRRERTKDVPIIFLTAIDNEPHHAFRGYAAGAVDYLSKPFDPWVLRAKVQVFVDLYMKNRQLLEQAELLRARLPGPGGGGARIESAEQCSTSSPPGWRRSRSRLGCSPRRRGSPSTRRWASRSVCSSSGSPG